MLMQKRSKTAAKALSCALAVALIFTATLGASAYAQEYASMVLRTDCDEIGITFHYYASLYVDEDTNKRAATWIYATATGSDRNVNMAAGQLGAQSTLYDENGVARKETTMQYNSTKIYFMDAETEGRGGTYGYYSKGKVSFYSGTGGFVTTETPATATKKAAIGAAPFARMLTADGDYPVNAAGETYGSGLLSEIVGHEPDLIAAIGENDVFGYLRAEDLNPNISTPEEAIAYMTAFDENRMRPLYDLNGAVVGAFVLDKISQPSNQEPSVQTITLSDDDLAARLGHTLVNGDYPVNSRGESYGSTLLSGVVGHYPDLILTAATNGKIGYMRLEDWLGPAINTPEEAIAYMESGAYRRTVPIYDLEGNVIGEFIFDS